MGRLTPQGYSLLPRLDDVFFVVRAVAFVGLGLWAVFSPQSPLAQTPVVVLLALFALHLTFFLFAITRQWVTFSILHYVTLVFDLAFISLLVFYTGGPESTFYLLFFLFLPFGAYALGSRAGLVAAIAATVLYVVAIGPPESATAAGFFLLRLAILWVFIVGAGYFAMFTGQSEKRLLNALDKLNERTTELERAHRRLELVYEVSRDLGMIHRVGDLVERVLFIARNLLGYPCCELLIWDRPQKKLLLHGRVQDMETTVFPDPRMVHVTPVLRAVLETGETRRTTGSRQESPPAEGKKTYRSLLAVPMTFQSRTVGILTAYSPELNAFSERDEQILAVLANSAAMAFENASLHRQMEQLTILDELTGIFNYRYFRMRLADEQKRAARYGQPLSLIMIDIDWFKRFNDTYGHETGNRLLQGISRTIAGCVRDVDILARYGGEEFIVILPQTGQGEAYKIGERIRAQIAEARFEIGPNGQELASVTVSVGISCFPENGRTQEELVELVDQALYRAKGAGKNLVCTV